MTQDNIEEDIVKTLRELVPKLRGIIIGIVPVKVNTGYKMTSIEAININSNDITTLRRMLRTAYMDALEKLNEIELINIKNMFNLIGENKAGVNNG